MPDIEARGPLSRPLRNRNFRLFWLGQGISLLGNAMYRVTLAWSVYRLTGSTADMGLTLAANIIPMLALSLYGGVLADRLSRRTVLLACDCAAAIVTGALAYLTLAGRSSVAFLVAASFALGVVSAFFGPAHNPLLRNILPTGDQQAAAAIFTATNSIVTITGPLLASLIFALWSPAGGFAVDAATFVFSVLCTLSLSITPEKVRYSGTAASEVRDGLTVVLRTTWLRITILLSVIANLVCVGPLYVLLPEVILKAGGNGQLLGVVTAVQAGATTVFALLAGKYAHRAPRGVTVYGLVITTGAGVALLGAGSHRYWMILASMAVIGLGFAFNVIETAMIQELIPQRYLARVYSVNVVASFALAPIGYAGSGALANLVGFEPVLIGGGLILAGCALASALATRWRLTGEVAVPVVDQRTAAVREVARL